MGGKNPMIVLDDANLDLAMEGGCGAASGPPDSAAPRPAASLCRKASTTNSWTALWSAPRTESGQWTRRNSRNGTGDQQRQLETDLNYVEIGKREGAKLMCGGHRLDQGDTQHGWFMEPTVFAECGRKMRIAQEEIFGPVVAMIPFSSLDGAIEIANGIKYGLSASLYTRDVNQAFAAMRDLETGITYMNAPTIGAEIQLPFGGTKGTGNGHREGGIAAIDFYPNGSRFTSIIATSCEKRRSTKTEDTGNTEGAPS